MNYLLKKEIKIYTARQKQRINHQEQKKKEKSIILKHANIHMH